MLESQSVATTSGFTVFTRCISGDSRGNPKRTTVDQPTSDPLMPQLPRNLELTAKAGPPRHGKVSGEKPCLNATYKRSWILTMQMRLPWQSPALFNIFASCRRRFSLAYLRLTSMRPSACCSSGRKLTVGVASWEPSTNVLTGSRSRKLATRVNTPVVQVVVSCCGSGSGSLMRSHEAIERLFAGTI